jgi:hypothetical protein
MPKNKMQERKDNVKKNKDNKPVPNTDTPSPTSGSMSEGNQSNNSYGRERRQTPHSKTFITGSDDDGQAV